jgi:hypothetical protein
MIRKNVLFPVVVAMAMLGVSTAAYAKNSADDKTGGVDAQPHALARNGTEDNGVDPKPHALARNGTEDNGVDPKPHALA